MLIKKYEAPTIQEALDTIKRELGPEAVILQTKKYKKGFGLMSRPSVEVTVAVSEKSIEKKQSFERSLTPESREVIGKLPAERQRRYFDEHYERSERHDRGERTESRQEFHAPQQRRQEQVSPRAASGRTHAAGAETADFLRPGGGSRRSAPAKDAGARAGRVTPVRYADIQDDENDSIGTAVSGRDAARAAGGALGGVMSRLLGRGGESESAQQPSRNPASGRAGTYGGAGNAAPAANAGFTYSDATLERARAVMAAANDAESRSVEAAGQVFASAGQDDGNGYSVDARTGYFNFNQGAAQAGAALPGDGALPDSSAARISAAFGGEEVAAASSEAELKDEVERLKRMILEIQSERESVPASASAGAIDAAFATPALQDALEMLVMNGLERRYAVALMKQVVFGMQTEGGNPASADDVMDRVAIELMENTEVVPMLDGITARRAAETSGHTGSEPDAGTEPGTAEAASTDTTAARSEPVKIALIGPTGVGKTTTAAKIASEAVRGRGLRVGLISYASGAEGEGEREKSDSLGVLARILHVPYRRVTDRESLEIAMGEFGHLDLVIVDAGGRSHRDSEWVRSMQESLSSVQNLRSHLVLSSTTRDAEMYDAAKRFSSLRPDGLIFTKLDEAMIFGSIYNVSQKFKLPLVYFTTGQGVPDDIEPATPERLAGLVMDL